MLFNSQQKVKDYLNEYASKLGEPVTSLKEEKFEDFLETVKWLHHYDEYYAIIDLKTQVIRWNFGFGNHLGYADDEITGKEASSLQDLVHPFIRGIDELYSASFLTLRGPDIKKRWNIMKTRFIINIPVRKKNGTYVLVKRMSLPLQCDVDGRVVSLMNVYTIVSSYHGQALRPRFFEETQSDQHSNRALLEVAANFIDKPFKSFTAAEFLYGDAFIESFSRIEQDIIKYKLTVADVLDIKGSTMNGKERKIRAVICRIFDYPQAYKQHPESSVKNFLSCLPNFNSMKDAIHYLHKSGILSVLKIIYENNKYKKLEVKNF